MGYCVVGVCGVTGKTMTVTHAASETNQQGSSCEPVMIVSVYVKICSIADFRCTTMCYIFQKLVIGAFRCWWTDDF